MPDTEPTLLLVSENILDYFCERCHFACSATREDPGLAWTKGKQLGGIAGVLLTCGCCGRMGKLGKLRQVVCQALLVEVRQAVLEDGDKEIDEHH